MDIYIGFSLQIYVIQVRRKPTENLQKTYKKSGNGILFICLIANCEICGTNLITTEKYIPTNTSKTKDNKKKEIINRFSNGVMVDESIAALQEDMIPIQESLKQAELNVANHTGRVETLQEQINTAITESTERSQKKAERIANWNEAIAGKRAYIREQNVLINKCGELLNQFEKTDEVLQKLENSK